MRGRRPQKAQNCAFACTEHVIPDFSGPGTAQTRHDFQAPASHQLSGDSDGWFQSLSKNQSYLAESASLASETVLV